jgi:hypothetical protein
MNDLHRQLYQEKSPIIAFYYAFWADYQRHISIYMYCNIEYVIKCQKELDEAMDKLKRRWNFKEKITCVELTGTFAGTVEMFNNSNKTKLLCLPCLSQHYWDLLYHDAYKRYGHAAAELMYPIFEGVRSLGLCHYSAAMEAFEARLMGTLKPTYAEVLQKHTDCEAKESPPICLL